MEKLRIFIAIAIPAEIKTRIDDLQSALKGFRSRISWTKPDNVHLTLKFLGDVEKQSIEAVSAAIDSACTGAAPFELSVQGTGAFPNSRAPRVLWVGFEGELEKLFDLQKHVERELAAIGLPEETRKFSAHLTIGRVKSLSGIQPVMQTLAASVFDGGKFVVNQVDVMQSVLHRDGAIYTRLSQTTF
ncbi:RNA 2',3'-cyclic phosphodiesterase [candidate division KSB1 bacterium]|nr:RNA 2',3'-cyclic phosphodiesterase [candidate division KSB1 bacterium]